MSKRFLLSLLTALVALGAFAAAAQAESGGSTHVTKSKPPAGTFVARIGWFYTDVSASDFPQSKVGPAVFHWGACAKAGGVQMAFPLNSHIYQGVNGAEFSTTKKTIARLSGPPLNPSDPFTAEIYVGDLAEPGMTTLKMECIGRSHGTSGPLVTKMTGLLKTEYVRKDINLKPANSITALNLLDVFGTEPVTQDVIVRSCSEPGTPSITLSSPALAAGPQGGSYVTIPANDALGTFEGLETLSKEAPAGEYPTVVSCGTGRIGVGVIGIH